MAEESTIDVRGLWDQKPGKVRIPSGIAKICHDFSKEQNIDLQDRNSSREDSVIFEPFTPVVISVRGGRAPDASAAKGLRWSQERSRIYFSCNGEQLHPVPDLWKASDGQGFGMYLLLGYVLRQEEYCDISVLAGPVNDAEDSFVLLTLHKKDRKRLDGFHIGKNPCTNLPGTFQSATALVRLNPTSFSSVEWIPVIRVGHVVAEGDECCIAWQNRFLLPSEEFKYAMYRAKMEQHARKNDPEHTRFRLENYDLELHFRYQLFLLLADGDEVLAHQLFYRCKENRFWNPYYVREVSFQHDLRSLTLLEQHVLGSDRWQEEDARLSLLNKLDWIRRRSESAPSIQSIPNMTLTEPGTKVIWTPFYWLERHPLERIMPDNYSEERTVVQITCVHKSPEIRHESYSMIVLAQVYNTDLMLLREQGTGQFFLFNPVDSRSLPEYAAAGAFAESSDDGYCTEYYDSDGDYESSAGDRRRDGIVPLGALVWLKHYSDLISRSAISDMASEATHSTPLPISSSCKVSLHTVHQGTFQLRILNAIEDMAKNFRTDYDGYAASTSEADVSFVEAFSKASLDSEDCTLVT